MCQSCWKDYLTNPDCPGRITPQISDAVEALRDLYAVDETGGAMHVVVDDWNLTDYALEWCMSQRMTPVERRVGELMARMSVSERATALAVHEGFLSGSNTDCD